MEIVGSLAPIQAQIQAMAAQGPGQSQTDPNLRKGQAPPRGDEEQTRDPRNQGPTPPKLGGASEESRASGPELAQQSDAPQRTLGATQQEELCALC